MASKKVYDLAVKVGEYVDGQGKTKGRYQNVGAVLQNDDGGKMILMERWFNPAGVPNPDGRATVLISMFEPQQQGSQQQAAPQRAAPQSQQAAPPDKFDDDIPFAPVAYLAGQ